MMRIFAHIALITLVVLAAGCTRTHTRAQGPFAQKKKEPPPPPYGSIPSADTPKDDELRLPSAGNDDSDDPNSFPPFKRRTKPQPEPLPSPFTPMEPAKESSGTAKTPAETPTAPKAVAKDLVQLKELLATSEKTWKAVDTYEATLTRREVNPKGQSTSEVLLFQFRREPMSVFTRNIGGGGKGREVVYNPSKHNDKMYIMLGEGDSNLRIAKAGFIAPPISPDDAKVTEKSRYSIRDAGFGNKISVLSAIVTKIEAGKLPADTLTYQASVKRDEYKEPLVGITHKLRPGDEPLMPAGGTRQYFFDMTKGSPSYGMPVLTIATDSKENEVEYYLYEKVKSPANLSDADFNPARLGKK